MLAAMGIFGTVGIFVRYIPLASATIAFFRGLVGLLFLLSLMLLSGKKIGTAKGHIKEEILHAVGA